MATISTFQPYIDNVLYVIQCCIGKLTDDIANQEFIGYDCPELKEKLLKIYAVQLALLKYNPVLGDDNQCLTAANVNILINYAKTVCKKCCIDTIEES